MDQKKSTFKREDSIEKHPKLDLSLKNKFRYHIMLLPYLIVVAISLALSPMPHAQTTKLCAPLFAENESKYKLPNNFDDYRESIQKFLNVKISGSADLNAPFVAGYDLITGEVFNSFQKYVFSTLPTLELKIYRAADDDMTRIPKFIKLEKGIPDSGTSAITAVTLVPTKNIIHDSKAALTRLYHEFSKQGPERQSLVETVMHQDNSEGSRVVHFTMGILGQTFGHSQILLSYNNDHPLHIEEQWHISIPGRKKGEWGRLSFFASDETTSRVAVDGFELTEGAEIANLARTELIFEIFSYAFHDASLDSLCFQVNRGISKVLSKLGVPLHLAQTEALTRDYEGKQITEFKYVMDRSAINKTVVIMIKKILALHLKKFLLSNDSKKLVLRFTRNKFSALIDLGILQYFTNQRLTKRSSTFGQKYLDLLSNDFKSSNTLFDFTQNVVLSWGPMYDYPNINSLLKDHYEQFQTNGIFRLPEDINMSDVEILSLHFSRQAAISTLKILED